MDRRLIIKERIGGEKRKEINTEHRDSHAEGEKGKGEREEYL